MHPAESRLDRRAPRRMPTDSRPTRRPPSRHEQGPAAQPGLHHRPSHLAQPVFDARHGRRIWVDRCDVETAPNSGRPEQPAQENPGVDSSAHGGDAPQDNSRTWIGAPNRPSRDAQQACIGRGSRPGTPEEGEVRLVPHLPEPHRLPRPLPHPEFAPAPISPHRNAEEARPGGTRTRSQRRPRRFSGKPGRRSVDERLDPDAGGSSSTDLPVHRPKVVLARRRLAFRPVDGHAHRLHDAPHPSEVLGRQGRLRYDAEEPGRQRPRVGFCCDGRDPRGKADRRENDPEPA
jgi:hypothetical protein